MSKRIVVVVGALTTEEEERVKWLSPRMQDACRIKNLNEMHNVLHRVYTLVAQKVVREQ